MQDWIKKVVLIRCPAPLPEDPASALLTRMLTPTPYRVSAEGGESGEPKGDARHGKKRAASGGQEGKPSKRGKMPLSGGLGRASEAAVGLYDKDEPLAKP